MASNESTIIAAGQKVNYSANDIEEFIKCRDDIIYFAENYYTIINVDKGKQKFTVYDRQREVLRQIVDPGDKRNVVLLSARQIGKSTMVDCYLLWYALFNEDKEILILANKERVAIKLLRKIKLAYTLLPDFLKQGIIRGGWNTKEIRFDNGSNIAAAATSSDAARSESINVLYLDEFAIVPNHISDDFMSSVYPTISSGKTTRIIISSTPKGMNAFYDIFTKAQKGINSFTPMIVKWNEIPGRDEAFKEMTITDIGIKRWKQEYELQFLGSSGSLLIEATTLESIPTTEPLAFEMENHLKIFEYPVPNAVYLLGGDVGKGVGKDASVAVIMKMIDIENVKIVAVYKNNKIHPKDFSLKCVDLSKKYNEALMLIENNDIGRIVTNDIWHKFEYDKLVNVEDKHLGIPSNSKTKLASNMIFRRYVENKWLEVNDIDLVKELSTYEENKPNRFEASTKQAHDDIIAAARWALYFFETEAFSRYGLDIKAGVEEEKPVNPVLGDDEADGNEFDWDDPNIKWLHKAERDEPVTIKWL
jgi:hypothetical protein